MLFRLWYGYAAKPEHQPLDYDQFLWDSDFLLLNDEEDSGLKSHFNPDQPRVPAGSPGGGEWGSGGGGKSSKGGKESKFPEPSAGTHGKWSDYYKGWSEKTLSNQQSFYLASYAKGLGFGVNETLRNPDKDTAENRAGARESAKIIDGALASAPGTPEDMVVYRGLKGAAYAKLAKDLESGKRKVGDFIGSTYLDKGFVSTTMNTDAANHYGGNLVRLAVPKGTTAAYLGAPIGDKKWKKDQDEFYISNDMKPSQRVSLGQRGDFELLLPRNAMFRITGMKVEKVGATKYLPGKPRLRVDITYIGKKKK